MKSKLTLNDIKDKAAKLGIKAGKMSKKDLIHKIQTAEGNIPCFETDQNDCQEMNCTWRDDCIK